MITLKDWMIAINYRITEGSEHGWTCYGPRSYVLSFWDQKNDGASTDITFDTATQVIYEVTVQDYKNGRAYRLMNPEFVAAYKKEAEMNSAPYNEAWEDVSYVDVDVDEDFMEKLVAILSGEEYDTRVMIQLRMTDEEELLLMRAAHVLDITVNEFVQRALEDAVAQHKGA